MMMTFQRAFAGNNGLQSFLGKVTDKLQEWIDGFGDPNSPAQKFVDKLSDAITWISEKLGELFDNLVPLLERFGKWAGELLQKISDGKFKATVGQFFGDVFLGGLKYAFKAVFTDPTIYGSIVGSILGYALVPFTGGLSMLLGPVIGGAIGHLFGTPSDDSSSSASSNSSPDQRKNDLAPLTGQLREYLDQNRKDQARYKGLKDTDVVLGRDGNISLAGLERIKLEEKEDALLKAQKDLSDSTQDLNITMKEAIIAISNMNGTPEAKAEADKKIQALEADRNATLPVRVRDAVGNEAMFVH
jgi:hypothetical protein